MAFIAFSPFLDSKFPQLICNYLSLIILRNALNPQLRYMRVEAKNMKDNKEDTARSFENQEVLNELLADCRQSTSAIATSCGITKQRVWKKIKELENDHTIWRYSSVINETKIGCTLYMALVKMGPLVRKTAEKIIERHKDSQAVGRGHVQLIESCFLNGIYDWMVMFAAKNIADAKKYCAFLQTVYGDFIKHVELLEIMFPAMRSGTVNPEIQQLQEFAIPNGKPA